MVFEKKIEIKDITPEIIKRINEDTRRIRSMEEKMERVENRLRNLEDGALAEMEKLRVILERIENRIADISTRLSNMDNEIIRINKELGKAATKAELKQIETFVDILNPIKARFITRDELERILEERIQK